jgi:hypothetical protein
MVGAESKYRASSSYVTLAQSAEMSLATGNVFSNNHGTARKTVAVWQSIPL